MIAFVTFFLVFVVCECAKQNPLEPKIPNINWGKCPQLEPKTKQSSKDFDACLAANPIPKTLNEKTIIKHQKKITECALRRDNWFSKSGNYRFARAEMEIKEKGLTPEIQEQLLQHHKTCRTEARTKFPTRPQVMEQVVYYQTCMDFHTWNTCGITSDAAPNQ